MSDIQNSLNSEQPFSSRKETIRPRVRKLFAEMEAGKLTKSQLENHITSMIAVESLNADSDSLTNIANRREFNKRIQSLLDQNVNFGLVIMDIDHFKKFNDQYGHTVGDEVLVHVARKIKKLSRGTDFVARYGGEEIVLVGFFENENELLEACERLRSGVESINSFTSGQKTVPGVTISLGAGIFTGGDFNSFFGNVDGVLYEAKESGRNQFKIFKEENLDAK